MRDRPWAVYVLVAVAAVLAMPFSAMAQDIASADAILSDSTPVFAGGRDKPVQYIVDFEASFSSITEVTLSFVFSAHDPLDPEECLVINVGGFGFCNVFSEPQFERDLTFPCSLFPDVCAAWLDGSEAGDLSMFTTRFNPKGRPIGRSSVVVEKFTVLIDGVPQ